MSRNNYKGIDSDIVKIVRGYVKNVIEKRFFPEHFQDDLEQECIFAVMAKFKKFNPKVGSRSFFIRMVTKNTVISVWRKEISLKQGAKNRLISLNQNFANSSECLLDAMPGKDISTLFQLELEEILQNIPLQALEVIQLSVDGFSKEEIAKRVGVSRATVFNRLKLARNLIKNN